MSLRKMASINRFSMLIFIPIMLVLALLTVLNSAAFLSGIAEFIGSDIEKDSLSIQLVKVSAQEIMTQSVCGISDNGGKQIIDIIGFSLPYLILAFAAGLLIIGITENTSRFLYIIRQKTYENWLFKNLRKVFLWLLAMWTLYYTSIAAFSILFSENTEGLGKIFYFLNTKTSDVIFEKIILLQYILGFLICLLIASSLFMLSLILKDASKAYTYLSMTILLFVFLGMFDIYNPFMISKHSVINNQIAVNPLLTFMLLLAGSLVCIFISKTYLRRKGL